jgi:hypothetical protein
MVNRQSGSALVLALAALAVVGLCVLVVAGQVQNQQAAARYDHRNAALGALSDAAFAESLALLSVDDGSSGVAPRELGGGTISSTVVVISEHRRRVVATASFRGWTATIEAEVDVATGPVILRVRRSQAPEVAGIATATIEAGSR